ncbi:hypothetical protein HK101_008067, partial [Irineochytrium annulatum]
AAGLAGDMGAAQMAALQGVGMGVQAHPMMQQMQGFGAQNVQMAAAMAAMGGGAAGAVSRKQQQDALRQQQQMMMNMMAMGARQGPM